MAASEETLMSVGHLNRPNVNTFSIYRNLRGNMHKRSTQYDFSSQRHQMLHTIRLQQRWQELKDRESAARHHNQELMQKFDTAQDTLKEMMAATAAMKSIRMEYDQFLVESYPCRQKQQKEKSQVHHKTMMAEYMKMCLKREEEYGSTSSVGKALYAHSHGREPQKDAVTQAYNGQGGSYPSFMDSPSRSHSDQTMATSIFPSTLLPRPQGFQLQHLLSTVPQNAPGWALDQADGPRSSVEDAETSSFSRRMSVHLSQELDFKPVRLSSEHVENRGDNTSSSSSVCGRTKCDKKKKRNTSEKNRRTSQKSSRTSSSVGAKTIESEASSHTGSTSSKMKRNITALAGLPMTTPNETRERESPKSRSISRTQSEHEVSQSLLRQSDSSRGNSPSRSEESSGGSDTAGGKKDNQGREEDKEADSKSDEKEESDMEGDSEDEEVPPENEWENESDKDRGSDDVSEKLKRQNKEQDSALLQDEEEHDDQSEDESEEEELAERDSDDVIISPQQNKPRVHFIPQEASEDDDGNEGATTATSDEDSSDPGDDDIENLLAPHPQTRDEKDSKTVKRNCTTPKVICNVEIFRGEKHTEQQGDSDEFDHFYD
ncbi:uncharacterized protein ACBT44_006935 isoform 2-T2 [Syngnathus typhle]